MKINPGNVSGAGTSGAEQAALDKAGKAAASRAAAGAQGAGGEDRIELSGLGRQLRLLAADTPERTERIEQLRAAVSSGNYEVNASEVSRRLIDDVLTK